MKFQLWSSVAFLCLLASCVPSKTSFGQTTDGRTFDIDVDEGLVLIEKYTLNFSNGEVCTVLIRERANNGDMFPVICDDGTKGTANIYATAQLGLGPVRDVNFRLDTGVAGSGTVRGY